MPRWRIAAGLALAGAAAAGYVAARSGAQRVTREVERAAVAAGTSVQRAHFSWLGPLRLEGVTLHPDAQTLVTADAIEVEWRFLGGAEPRAHVAGLAGRGVRVQRGPLAIDLPAVAFAVVAWDGGEGEERVRLRQRPQGGTLEARWTRASGGREARLVLGGLDLSAARVRWAGETVLAPGRWSGEASLRTEGGTATTTGALSLDAARVSWGPALGGEGVAPGEPTSGTLEWSAHRQGETLVVERASIRLAGLRIDGRGRLDGPAAQRQVDAELAAEAELGAALRTAGLRLPAPIVASPSAPLGTAFLDVSLRGPLADASALRIVPRLRFEATPAAVEALQFLKRPFRFVPQQPAGTRIDVGTAAADFVPLGGVPPLFVRMLLLSEDAGFFGHPGIDVAEIPVAWATNAERGGFARGASTITQQLARNLFLSRDKSYARKVEEAALALMMDAAVPKARVLEIYLNVIEWGPGIHGLVPAARHYFGKDPSQLTAKEMAFLVCLIPSPVRYHSAHRAGRAGPGMEELMQNLLAKMYEAGALSEEECLRASEEVLTFAPEDGGAADAAL
jgi:transglycosylase-like protein